MIDDIIDEYETPESRMRTRKQEEARTMWKRIAILVVASIVVGCAVYFPFFYNNEEVVVYGVVYETDYDNRGTHLYSKIYFHFDYEGEKYRCMEQQSIHSRISEGDIIEVRVNQDNPEQSIIRPARKGW